MNRYQRNWKTFETTLQRLAIVSWITLPWISAADGQQPTRGGQQPTRGELQTLVENLDADSYLTRTRATRQLLQMAQSDSESGERILDLLRDGTSVSRACSIR